MAWEINEDGQLYTATFDFNNFSKKACIYLSGKRGFEADYDMLELSDESSAYMELIRRFHPFRLKFQQNISVGGISDVDDDIVRLELGHLVEEISEHPSIETLLKREASLVLQTRDAYRRRG